MINIRGGDYNDIFYTIMATNWLMGLFEPEADVTTLVTRPGLAVYQYELKVPITTTIVTQTNEVKDIPTEAHVENIKNKVHKTESGHIIEFDDTADAERINIKHKSGTTVLIDKDGGLHISSVNDTNDLFPPIYYLIVIWYLNLI